MSAPVIIHADESCLGNGRDGDNPGGAGLLFETAEGTRIVRRDLYLHAPATTNNRMALAGAIAAMAVLSAGKKQPVLYVSDSEYLVKGVNEWMPGWKRRDWRRKEGPILNLELWQALDRLLTGRAVTFRWVRGHAGHVKNEYADALAVKAAERQQTSQAAVESEFGTWLAARRAKDELTDYDPDRDYRTLAATLETR